RDERQQPRRISDHQRAQQRPARRSGPSAALAPPPGGLLGGGHERSVRGSCGGGLASPFGGGGGLAVGNPRAADRSGHFGVIRSSSSTDSPRRVAALPWLTATASRRWASS